MQEKLLEIKESSAFQFVVTTIILLSSIIVGVGTYEIGNDLFVKILFALDTFITVFFHSINPFWIKNSCPNDLIYFIA